MATNFESMMETMMEQMMMKMMEKTMEKMFSSMATPEVSPAEVATPAKKSPATMSRDEFLALSEEFEEEEVPMELDFVVYGSRTARYNRSVPSDIWTVNHLAITQKYGGKWSKKNGGYIFETPAELRVFLQSYKIKTELTEEDRHNVKLYKQERNKRKAEYYSELAKK